MTDLDTLAAQLWLEGKDTLQISRIVSERYRRQYPESYFYNRIGHIVAKAIRAARPHEQAPHAEQD